jgi:hypothetical protein
MTDFLHTLSWAEVVDYRTYARYAQQNLGTPEPIGREIGLLQKKVNVCFEQNPAASWSTLASLVDWAKAKHRRTATAWGLLGMVRYAWVDGMLPELDPVAMPTDDRVEFGIEAALERETDEWWRRRLIGSVGLDNRRQALVSWRRKEEERRADL